VRDPVKFLEQLLGTKPEVLALVAIVLLAAAVFTLLLRRNGRGRVTLSLGQLFQGPPAHETLTPAAATWIDNRIEHKWRTVVSEPLLRLTADFERLKKWLGRVQGESREMAERQTRVETQVEGLDERLERIEEKLDRLIERR
jgi:hypothetical protein